MKAKMTVSNPRDPTFTVQAMVALSVGLIGVACARPIESPTENPSPRGTSVSSLTEGWMLVSAHTMATTDFLRELLGERWAAWGIERAYDSKLERVVVRYHRVAELGRYENYWFYLAPEGMRADGRGQAPPALGVGADTRGYLFSPTQPIAFSRLGADKAFIWDTQSQAWAPFEGILEPGKTVWLVPGAESVNAEVVVSEAPFLLVATPNEEGTAAHAAPFVLKGEVHPESSALQWKVTSFAAEGGPKTLGSDPVMPRLVVEVPGEGTLFTNRPLITVQGEVDDAQFAFLRINDVIVTTSTGAFEQAFRLTAGENQLEFVARDDGENEVRVVRTVVLDRAEPDIQLDRGPDTTVYKPKIEITGFVAEPDLDSLILTHEETAESQMLPVHGGRFAAQVVLRAGSNRFSLRAMDAAGNQATRTTKIVYSPVAYQGTQASLAPQGLVAWADEDAVHLRWSAPHRLIDGSPIPEGADLRYRVFRDGEPAQDVDEPWYDGTGLEPGRYALHVAALVPGAHGVDHVSERSSQARLELGLKTPGVSEDGFESPSAVTPVGIHARLPVMAISTHGQRTDTFMVYVAHDAHPSGGDEVRLLRSSEFASADSWSQSIPLGSPAGWRVGDLAVAAQGSRVLVAWICVRNGDDRETQASRLLVASSTDGGARFALPQVLREGRSWKRGVDIAIDHLGNSHLVWGEASKAYYLKNLEGAPSSVFDVRKRRLATEEVKYKAYYEPADDGACDCPECWCEESYTVAGTPDPDDGGQPRAFVVRLEEAHVTEPSLHVDQDALSIVVRQRRLWDHDPVPHPPWFSMYESPVYSDTIIQRKLPTKMVVGWRNTWKQAYEPGDEALWDGLGIAYQYRYQGSWHKNDHIRVAQRPLIEGAWADGQGPDTWRQGVWKGDAEQAWRFSVVDERSKGFEKAPARPKVFTAPSGEMVAVFEKGASSDPNRSGSNAIHVSYSDNGGLDWTPSTKVATGYVPDLAIATDGTMGIVYYAPGTTPEEGRIELIRDQGNRRWDTRSSMHVSPPKPVHWKSHGENAGVLHNVPAIAVHEELMVAAWVRAGVDASDGARIVTSRGGRPSMESKAVRVRTPAVVSAHQSAPIHVACVNQFYMETSGCAKERPIHVLSSSSIVAEALDDLDRSRTVWVEFSGGPNTRSLAPRPPGRLESVASLEGSTPLGGEAPLGVALASIFGESSALNPTRLATALVEPVADRPTALLGGANIAFESPQVLPGDAEGNYLKAKILRDKLFDSALGAQREYDGKPTDADYASLVRFGRVWAYTQGIALAQYAVHDDPRAYAIADFVCDSGLSSEADGTISGWPFSWNTDGDSWRDARQVTGANAWVIHGLGVFISSNQFAKLSSDVKNTFGDCYQRALGGLGHHFDHGVHLVTAGITASGLKNADRPGDLFPVEEPEEQWAYYGILDAIGYEDFDSDNPPRVQTFIPGSGSQRAFGKLHTLTELEFEKLKEPTKALNVVTEHNLDALSVLNHYLANFPSLGGGDRAIEAGLDAREIQEERKEVWTRARNRLNDAIFDRLWDENEGRIVTGGTILGPGLFDPSHHTAIDNCSWLSLSVDYGQLSNEHQSKLSRCLAYTVKHFVKLLKFSGKDYYGTHYFPRSFKDPYIEQTDDQEKLYHLEATTGLILGLLRFADAVVDDPRSDRFQKEANKMWRHMQVFVRDHGFPYSTYKIQDLMTQLESSTAAIWFIDVYDYYASRHVALDKPLRNYAEGVQLGGLYSFTNDTLEALRGKSFEEAEKTHQLIVTATGKPGADGSPSGIPHGRITDELRQKGHLHDYRVALLLDDKSAIPYAPDGFVSLSVPVNVADITLEVRTERRSGGGLLDGITDYFWPTYWDFSGTIRAKSWEDIGSDYRVVITSLTDEGEVHHATVIPERDNGGLRFATSIDSAEIPGGNIYRSIARLATFDRTTEALTFVAATGAAELHTGIGATVHKGLAGEWYFHTEAVKDYREVELFRLSTKQVLDRVAVDALGANLIVSTEMVQEEGAEESDSVAVTFIHDQALALLGAAHAGDYVQAERWADGLLGTLVKDSSSGTELMQFPYAVASDSGSPIASYYQTGSQLLAIYALVHLGRWSPIASPARQQRILDVATHILRSMETISSQRVSGCRTKKRTRGNRSFPFHPVEPLPATSHASTTRHTVARG